MAVIKSGASSDNLTIDATSKAARVTLYDATGREVAYQSKPTFFAANTFTPAATPTDIVTIYGSASKTVRVISFRITTTNTAAGSQAFLLVKRSAVNTTGTFVAGTAVPADSTDAATATVGHYTANPGGLGTLVGNVNIKRVASPAAIPATWAGIVQDAGYDMLDVALNSKLDKPLTLIGTGQGLCLNFAGAALVAGQTHAYQVVWTEE
jgi:hypothetical protein